ncbi:MAG: hypothetical protein K8H88_08500, partial [Sandaracinaceae bacterium]|nr:hypothetical protein [Sandaracinaceae bacterium]
MANHPPTIRGLGPSHARSLAVRRRHLHTVSTAPSPEDPIRPQPNLLPFALPELKAVSVAAILSVGLHGAAGVAMLFAPASWGTGTRPGASEVSIEIINPLEVD